MKLKTKLLSFALAASIVIGSASAAFAANETVSNEQTAVSEPRQMENLNRGGFAATNPARYGGGIYLSWRLLGTEPIDTEFNIYKNGELLTQTANTSYNDTSGTADDKYTVSPIINGAEGAKSEAFPMLNGTLDGSWKESPYAYFDVPIQIPPPGSDYTYSANDASVGDVDGDGEYEIILKWDPSNSKDSASGDPTGNVYIDCYEFDGTFLWRIDLGKNIRAGAHYTQFQVFDYDGNGKAEVAVKTAPGSIDGKGNYVSDVGSTETIRNTDNIKSYLGGNGHVTGGPEYLTIFNGETGAAMQTIDYDPPVGKSGDWGDSNYNRSDRFLAGTAYLDGVHPSMIFCRGYYAKSVAVAYDWDGTNITKRWKLDSSTSGNSDFAAQGNHQLSVADLDKDGKDEIIYGGAAIDDDGSLMWSAKYNGAKLGHGDALHVSDYNNDGEQEVFKVNEDQPGKGGVWGRTLINGQTGKPIFHDTANGDDGRGVIGNFSPKYGVLAWDSGLNTRTLDGTVVNYGSINQAGKQVSVQDGSSPNFTIFWDGDFYEEHFDGDRISKWHDYDTPDNLGSLGGFGRLWTLYSNNPIATNNSTKKNPCLQADLFGDWREEIILRHSDDSALRVFTSLIPTEHKLTTFMHDSQYRCAVAWQNTGYNQPPHQSYYIGEDKAEYVQPNIEVRELDPEIKLTVKNPNGEPAVGVNVKLGDIEKPTDSSGNVYFRVPAGSYSYIIDYTGYLLTSGTVELTQGEASVEKSIIAEPLPDSVITVVSGGAPISDAKLVTDSQTVITDAAGKATVKLREGEYDYTVSCHKFITKTGKFTVSETNSLTETVELEPINYIYDSDKDAEGTKFTYSGGDGAELTFDNGQWTLTQNSTDGGRSFGAIFDTSANGNVELEMIYKNGAQKDSSDKWNWTGREYTHVLELHDVYGNVIVGLSQQYKADGVQELQYYTDPSVKKNVSSGTLIGGGSITKRSSITWKLKFNIDLKNKTIDITVTNEAGENGFLISGVAINSSNFSNISIGTSASGNVTCAPAVSKVLYQSDCIANEHTVSIGSITGNGELKIVKPVPTTAPAAPDNWKASASLTAGASLINTDNAVITSDSASTYSAASTKIGGTTYSGRINVRVTSDTDMTPNASGNTALTIQAKKSGTLTVVYRRQYASGAVANDDSKDIRLANSGSLGTKISGATFTYEDIDGSYANATKTYTLESGQTYKLYGAGTTIGLFGIKYEPINESSDNEVLVDELAAYNGDTIKVKAVTTEKTIITTNPETEVTDIGDGYYTFIMSDADVTVNAEFKPDGEYPYTINNTQPSVNGINVNITKNSDTGNTDKVIVAVYDSETGVLKNIGFGDVNISSGDTSDIYVKADYSDNDVVIAYVWKSLSDITPLSKSFKVK